MDSHFCCQRCHTAVGSCKMRCCCWIVHTDVYVHMVRPLCGHHKQHSLTKHASGSTSSLAMLHLAHPDSAGEALAVYFHCNQTWFLQPARVTRFQQLGAAHACLQQCRAHCAGKHLRKQQAAISAGRDPTTALTSCSTWHPQVHLTSTYETVSQTYWLHGC